jgi:hypothetical protein
MHSWRQEKRNLQEMGKKNLQGNSQRCLVEALKDFSMLLYRV